MQVNEKGTVIVIGGGVSGITAANKLTQEGFQVTLFEGRERLGGRLWTDFSKFGYKVDLGGAWIHGKKGNPVFALAKSQNARMLKFDWEDCAYYSNDIEIKSFEQSDQSYYEIGDSFMDFLESSGKGLNKNNDKPISEILDTYLNLKKLNKEKKNYLLNYIAIELEGEYASQIERLSAKFYETEGREGGDYLLIDGYWSIFKDMVNFSYHLNSTVIEVNQTETNPYIILSDGKMHRAEFILVTVPLGVLKSNKIKFNPPLSQKKQSVIDAIGFGTLEKIVVEFSMPFWKNSLVLKFLENPISFLNLGINFHKICGKNTLIFLVPGESKYFSNYYTASEEELKEVILHSLQQHFPKEKIEIIKIVWTKWKQDPFCLGAYSSISVGSNLKMVVEFETIEGKLYFGGEHTDKTDFETIAGAYSSGIRAANQIFNSSKSLDIVS